jgi:SAM-dependent methyltransferase
MLCREIREASSLKLEYGCWPHDQSTRARLGHIREGPVEVLPSPRLKNLERVLDVGCGAGASSLALAARVGPGGQVLGVDISEPLIGRARALAPQDTPALFRVADASSAELPEGAFDILFSRFGVMFFDDPIGAFAHMRRALQPGGRVAFVCWRGAGENDWVRLPMGAIKGIVPPTAPPDPEAPGQFSFGDRGQVARILTAAGKLYHRQGEADHPMGA